MKVVIVDTWDRQVPDWFQELYPNVAFSVADVPWQTAKDQGIDPHPHGFWCASCVLSQLPNDAELEIVFLPIFDGELNAVGLDGTMWLDIIREIKADKVTCSFGAHHGNSTSRKNAMDTYYQPVKAAIIELANDIECDFFFAAGNEDDVAATDQPTRWFDDGTYDDVGNDVSYAQRLLGGRERIHIIGACERDGSPAWFTSDGMQVLCTYPGYDIPSYDPYDPSHLTRWSGSSGGCPMACSDSIAAGKSGRDYQDYVRDLAVAPPLVKERRPKIGYGTMNGAVLRNSIAGASLDMLAPPITSSALRGILPPTNITFAAVPPFLGHAIKKREEAE